MLNLVFDIETGPLPIDYIKSVSRPYDPESIGSHPGEFDPKSVKLGNIKDQAKIDEKVEACRVKHEAAVKEYEDKKVNGEAKYWEKIIADAALYASTGEVLAIGYLGDKEILDFVSVDRTEADLLRKFWSIYESCRSVNRSMIGFNILDFDLRFVIQRSRILGLHVPDSVLLLPRFYYDPTFIDLMPLWTCGFRNYVSLNDVARALGTCQKMNGVTGAHFANLFSNPDTQDIALEYLSSDLAVTASIAERLHVR